MEPFEIDHTSSIPLHKQVESLLRDMIHAPEYVDGKLLPKEVDMAKRLGISRTLYPRRYTVAAVERALGDLLRDDVCATRAREVAAVVRQEHGASRAADALEALVGSR